MLAPFKYGGYPLLLSAVTLPEDSEETNASHFLGPEKAPLLQVCTLKLTPSHFIHCCSASDAMPDMAGKDRMAVFCR